MFDPDKYDRTPYHWWPEHDRFFVNPAVGGLGLLVIVASLVYFVVGDARTVAAFVIFSLLVLPILFGFTRMLWSAVSSFR